MVRVMKKPEVISGNALVNELINRGYALGSGVPCSWLSFPNVLMAHEKFAYVMGAQEGDSVAIATGASIAGTKSIVTMQGSGLTNAGSPLTSLNNPFRVGVLLFISWRGGPGVKDEPQHRLMGEITRRQLDLWGVTNEVLATDMDVVRGQFDRADQFIRDGQSFALVVRKGTFDKVSIESQEREARSTGEVLCGADKDELPARKRALEALLPFREKGTVLAATTGYTGRELFELGDVPNQLMMVGSMGCVGSLVLGMSLVKPSHKFVAIDGDGALLMRMGSLATNGYYGPSNMLHVLLDNGCHESTSGQLTVSANVDWVGVAHACGYQRSVYAHSVDEFGAAVEQWHERPELTFLYLGISPGVDHELGRPTVTPAEVAQRLKSYLN